MTNKEVDQAKNIAKTYSDTLDHSDDKLIFMLASGNKSREEIETNERGLTGGDLKSLGVAILMRWSRSFRLLICGVDSEDAHFRSEILTAISGRQALGPVLAGIAVAAFGVSAAVAAIVGTLLARYIIGPSIEEICDLWDKKLLKATET